MKVLHSTTKFTALTVFLFILHGGTSHAKNLGDALRDSKWDGIIGTWIDPETKGRNNEISFVWQVKDHAILAKSAAFGTQSVALIGRNAKDGTVFHVGADDKGSSVLGKWTFKNDDAVLELGFVTGEGVEGVMKIRYVKKDENTLTVSLEGLSPQPIVYSLIKVKSAKEASRNAPYTPANPKRL